MKKFLLVGFSIFFYSLYCYAQSDGLLIAENFPYSNGNLTGQGSSPAWASGGGSGDVVVTALSDNSGALVHPGYSSGTSYVTTGDNNTTDPYKGFIGLQTISTANATTFYMSFVVRVVSSANVSRANQASPSVALRTSLGGNVCYFYAAYTGGGNGQHLKFGISKTGGAGDGSYASGNFSFNTTYLIVIRYDIVTGGTTNDRMYMWVNPLLNNEPATASADRSITTGTDGSASGDITALQLLEDNSAGTTADFDAFKIAYASGYGSNPSNSNVAWSDLAPVGAPLPVRFGSLKASLQSNNTIQLDWISYSEENVDHYEIERSSNGHSFTVIGRLNAQGNNAIRIDYTWLDESPLAASNFYRIKSVDIDGRSMYSSIVKISLNNTRISGISLYPNPVKGSEIALQFTNLQKGNYGVEVFNNLGQRVSQWQINLVNENTTQTLQLPSGIKAGTYSLRVSNGIEKFHQLFIVK